MARGIRKRKKPAPAGQVEIDFTKRKRRTPRIPNPKTPAKQRVEDIADRFWQTKLIDKTNMHFGKVVKSKARVAEYLLQLYETRLVNVESFANYLLGPAFKKRFGSGFRKETAGNKFEREQRRNARYRLARTIMEEDLKIRENPADENWRKAEQAIARILFYINLAHLSREARTSRRREAGLPVGGRPKQVTQRARERRLFGTQ